MGSSQMAGERSGVRARPVAATCDSCGCSGRLLGLTLDGVSMRVCPDDFARLVGEFSDRRFGADEEETVMCPALRKQVIEALYAREMEHWHREEAARLADKLPLLDLGDDLMELDSEPIGELPTVNAKLKRSAA